MVNNFCDRFKEIFNQTMLEANNLLLKYGKCAVLRPTGFGKTVLLTQIASQPRYKRVIYVYPAAIVKEQAQHYVSNSTKITWCTYTALGRYNTKVDELYKEVISKHDLIVFDEMHHMGAKQVKTTISNLLPLIDTSKIHIIGSTATPKRMDGYDVIDSFFDNYVTTFYGINNALSDGIISKPVYVYSIEGYKSALHNFYKLYSSLSEESRRDLKIDIKASVSKLDKLTNASLIIADTVNSVYQQSLPSYMRFIVFYTSKEILSKRSREVHSWFKSAFPTYRVNKPLTIISGSHSQSDIGKLAQLTDTPNTIDLIYCINMLNEGYHISNITGIVLLRPTQSPTVYTQQIGRCLHVGIEHSPIIFDFVSNIATNSIFDLSPIKTQKSLKLDLNSVEDQMDNLSEISPDNIMLIDKVAPVKAIISKLEAHMPTSIEQKVIEYRKQYSAPADALSKAFDIPYWEILLMLDKHHDILFPLGLQRQEQDNYIIGDKRRGLVQGETMGKSEGNLGDNVR